MAQNETTKRSKQIEPIISSNQQEFDNIDEPDQSESKDTLGTYAHMIKDPQWNGVPPVGTRPISDRWRFLMLIIVVFIVKIIIWSGYRFASGNWVVLQDPVNNYTASLFAKPILQLTPVILIWWYLFKERGLPFRFTRKNLFSSIIFGCLGGLLFFFVASGLLVGYMELRGFGTDFTFVAGWDDVGWALVIAMMFSYMISTGPAEELFSRGFLQDQSARAFSLKHAILFSAVLFALGHVPISVFMHRMSAGELGWYMVTLVIMGVFFSVIYQWSRNIVLPIIIHGLWDWYLTLFSLKGAYSSGFLANKAVNFGEADFINTILTLAIMLPIFYVIYRVWWRYDEPRLGPLGGLISALERIKLTHWIRRHDRGDWPIGNPVIITGSIVGIFCLLMIPMAAVLGTEDTTRFEDRIMDGEFEEIIIYENGSLSQGATLNEHESSEFSVEFNASEIERIDITLTWTDEPPADLRYENKPDTFYIELQDPEANVLDFAEANNGNLVLSWAGEVGTIYKGTFTVIITLVDAGNQETNINIIGLRTVEDNANEYSLSIDYVSFTKKYTATEAGDVRWGEEELV